MAKDGVIQNKFKKQEIDLPKGRFLLNQTSFFSKFLNKKVTWYVTHVFMISFLFLFRDFSIFQWLVFYYFQSLFL